MLRIFRRIRQSLVTNKIGGYFAYAIGEIILVVIGILLALSINNWNEERKTRVKEEYFLLKLGSNLNDDIQYFNQVIEYEKKVAEDLDSMLLIIRNPDKFKATDLKPHNSSLFSFKRFYSNKTAFDNLVSSGQIDILKNQLLVEKLFTYYRDIDEQSISGDAALATYSRNNVGPFFMQFDFLRKQVVGTVRKEKSLLDYHADPMIDNLIVFKLGLIHSQLTSYDALVEKAEEIVKVLADKQE